MTDVLPDDSDCVGVLLTGGQSSRLGHDKATLTWNGMTLARRAATELAAVCGRCVEVGSGASGLAFTREEPRFGGPLAALLTGIDWLERSGPVGAAIVLACDYPLIERDLLALVRNWSDATVIPVWEGRPQYTCARWSPSTIAAARVQFAAGERGFRWMRDFAAIPEAQWRAVAPADAFIDVDTPEAATRYGIDLGRREG